MHGPPVMPNPYDGSTVHYVDSVVGTLSGAERRKWKRARNRALRLWEAGGIEFVREQVISAPEYRTDHPDYPKWDPDLQVMLGDEDAFMHSLLIPGTLHLLPMYENWTGSNIQAVGWMFEAGGFAVWNMNRFFSDDPKYLACHEIGHGLGLGHQKQSEGGLPSSVMYLSDKGYRGWSNVPNVHDTSSLKVFYS